MNEPWIISWLGYGVGAHAPGIGDSPGTKPYIASHNLIKAHARAWRVYDDEFRASQGGNVNIRKIAKIVIINNTLRSDISRSREGSGPT